MRFYEAMASGAVPILLGDTWQIPQIPGLSEAILIVRQDDVRRLTDIVSQDETNWELRQSRVVDLYKRYFCEDEIVDTVLDMITETQPTLLGQVFDFMWFRRYFHTKRMILKLSATVRKRR
jgi:hypothetical protein